MKETRRELFEYDSADFEIFHLHLPLYSIRLSSPINPRAFNHCTFVIRLFVSPDRTPRRICYRACASAKGRPAHRACAWLVNANRVCAVARSYCCEPVRVVARPCKATCLPSSGAHACTASAPVRAGVVCVRGAHVPIRSSARRWARGFARSRGPAVVGRRTNTPGTDATRGVHAFARTSIPRQRAGEEGPRGASRTGNEPRVLALSKTPLLELEPGFVTGAVNPTIVAHSPIRESLILPG